MIPADVASRLRLTTPDQPAAPQPVTPAGKLPDVLSDLVPGQRIMAEIQALLPNGMYRAVIAQRDITLALPFSAQTGDALELEVVDSDGRLTLALVANRGRADQGGAAESVSTSLSQAGKLIGTLLAGVDDQGGKGRAVPLNGNQPLLDDFPADAGQLAPALKEALSKSGMFYEAHQARWVEGKLPAEALLQEPQGKFSRALHSDAETTGQPRADALRTDGDNRIPGAAGGMDASPKPTPQGPIPADLAPLVRQQLDALATQTYVWQGQVWPGQQLHWEIEEERTPGKENGSEEGEQEGHRWRTRLKLSLPGLGGIEAVMSLHPAGSVDISLAADSDDTRQRLAAAGDTLRRRLEDAGLNLNALAVNHGLPPG